MRRVIMVDFHGTLKIKRGASLINKFVLCREVLGLLSGFKWFVIFMNSNMVVNTELIEKINNLKCSCCAEVVVTSAATKKARVCMEQSLAETKLLYDELRLRKSFWERHSSYKKRMALELLPIVVFEDCEYYADVIECTMKEVGNTTCDVVRSKDFLS